MVRKICLDSDVIISVLRKDEKTIEILSRLGATLYTTTINQFEIFYGARKDENLFGMLEVLISLVFDEKSAMIAADMQKTLRKSGHDLDFRDLFIGAVCIKNNVELLTLNKKHFERLENFGLILV